MLQTDTDHKHRAKAWLDKFSQELDTDSDMADGLSINDVRTELQALGADVKGFHSKLATTLRAAKLQQAGRSLIQWLSPLWQPQWAGEFVGAGDIPEQHHVFTLETGAVEISCSWKPTSGETPAYLDFSWKADTVMDGELWCRFVQPETQTVLADLPLGRSKEGGKYFTAHTLGFNPAREKWGIVMLVKPAETSVPPAVSAPH